MGTMFAEKVQIGDLYYNLDATNQTAEVTSQYSSSPYWSTNITTANIPSSVTYNEVTYSVTSIGNWAFYGCSGMTSVTIPNSVTSIGNWAFYGCSGMTSVTIPNSVTSIGYGAFYNCSGLTSVTIGNSVTSIGQYAFYSCSGLTSIEIPNSVASIEEYAFYNCTGLTSPVYNSHVFAYMPTSYIGAYTIPDGIESIASCAFALCSGLTSMTIPNSVTSIGYGAFYNCSGLTSVTIPNSVTSIGNWAFYGCSGMTSVTIPNSVTSIGYGAFYNCSGLTSVIWNAKNCADFAPNNTPFYSDGYYNDRYWDELKFDLRPQITSFTFGNEVEHIPANLCNGMSNLTSIEIPNSVTSIGEYAFSGCSGLTKVNIMDIAAWCNIAFSGSGSNPLSYAKHLYVNDEEVTELVFPNSVTSIGSYAFYNCSGLTSVTIPESVTSIGENAFYECSGLTTIYVTCGDLERVKQLYFNDNRVKYAPLKYHITGNVNIEGAGSVQLPQNECEDVITAIPNYGYHFAQWSDGVTDNPRTIVLTQDTTFTAEFAKNTYTITTESSNPQWGTTAGDNSALYLDEVEISATANYGYHFVKWNIDDNTGAISAARAYAIASALGAGETTTTQYTIYGYVTGPYGTYRNSYYLSDSPDVPGNFIAFKCASSVNIGQYVKVTGYLTNYKGNTPETTAGSAITPNDLSPFANPCSFTLRSNISFVAEFAKNMYTITKNAEHGTISGNTSAKYLDQVKLTANPDYGYHFTQWSDGNKENPRTFVLTQDTTFTAEFAKNTYTITTESSNPQWGTTAGDNSALYLEEVEISAIPNYGYHFVQWDDNNTLNPRSFTLTQDTTFAATFAKNVYTITLNNAEHGSISGGTSAEYLDEVTLTANPDYGYHFTQWSDGNKENPRTFVLTQDTTFNAEFAIDRTGTCGDDNALTWTYDPETKTLTITGNGTLNSNYYFGIEAPAQMQKLVIGNEVTSIGDSAFYGMSTINHLIIGGSVATIGNYAFAECRNFDDITCLANVVPVINETTFANVGNKQYIYLFVPAERERAYHRDTYWGEFDIQVQQAEETTVTTNDVTVEPQDNAATLIWPTNDNAASYTIEITKDGVLFCTLTFNANGQLTGIAFAPSRDGHAHAPAAVMTANGLQFTVTGLNSNTQYGYNLIAKDANNQPIATYSGEFTTTGEIATGIDNIQGNEVQSKKFVRNGQIYILRGEKVYNAQGALVK